MIINLDDVKNIYVASDYIDMRKSIDGLMLIVYHEFNLDVLDHSLFIFTNRARNRIKILFYENNGFWLLMKRLEHGKFKLNYDPINKIKVLNEFQLKWLLEGLDYTKIPSKTQPQKTLLY